MIVRNKYEAIVTGISNKVGEKVKGVFKFLATFNYKPIYNIINNPPPQEQAQFEKITDENEFIDKVAERVVEKLQPRMPTLVNQPQEEVARIILQESSTSAHQLILDTATGYDEVGVEEDAKVRIVNGETDSVVTPVRSTGPAKKPGGPDEGANL